MNGVSKKLTVAGVGIAALLTLADNEPNYLTYLVGAGIFLITWLAIIVQAQIDKKNGGK